MTDVPALVLLGVSGAGKSTVGRLLSEMLDRPLCEADDYVMSESGMSVAELVIAGDPRLDALRRQAAARVLSACGAIVTLGASQIEDPDTLCRIQQAKSQGTRVVELRADIADIARREGMNRPRSLALGAPRAMLARMIRTLEEHYAHVADSSVDTSGVTPHEVASLIARECTLAVDSPNPRD